MLQSSRFHLSLSALFVAATGLSGCQSQEPEKGVGHRVMIPWSESHREEIRLTPVALVSLPNPRSLKGAAVEIHWGSTMGASGLVGRVATPRVLRDSRGVWYPTDEESLLSVSAYAHFERLWRQDLSMGISHHLTWPRRVTLNLRTFRDKGASHDCSGQELHGHENVDSAAYYAHIDSVAVTRRSSGNIPIALNGGVLAHEHFHSYFHKLVMGPALRDWGISLTSSGAESGSSRLVRGYLRSNFTDIEKSNLATLVAIDEGLSDFAGGYVYGYGYDFVGQSIPSLRDLRNLTSAEPQFEIPSTLSWGQIARANNDCDSYSLGTTLARVLTLIAQTQPDFQSSQKRQAWGRRIVEGLQRMGPSILARKSQELIDPSEPLFWILEGSEFLNPEACRLWIQAVGIDRVGASCR